MRGGRDQLLVRAGLLGGGAGLQLLAFGDRRCEGGGSLVELGLVALGGLGLVGGVLGSQVGEGAVGAARRPRPGGLVVLA